MPPAGRATRDAGRPWADEGALKGRATVRNLLAVLLDERKHSVSAKTYMGDAALPRLLPTALGVIDQRGERSRDHTGVNHPCEKWLGRVVGG
jgi:hypothetical protein